jgi:AAA domain
MPSLTIHPSTKIVRLLNIGESGTGKTGTLASLAKAGYRLWVLDFDNGLDILAAALADEPEALARVEYETLRDNISLVGGVPKLTAPMTAWVNAGKTLARWEESLAPEGFTERDVVVIDTLTTMSNAAFNQALVMGSRLNQRPQQTDYGWMGDSVLLFMQAITEEDAKFNLVVNTHIRYLSNEGDDTLARGLPNAKGQMIPKDIGKFFNTVVLTRTQGSGPAAKRIISTKPQGVIEVKTANPFGVKDTYPIESGMADLFRDILGHGPASPPAKA